MKKLFCCVLTCALLLPSSAQSWVDKHLVGMGVSLSAAIALAIPGYVFAFRAQETKKRITVLKSRLNNKNTFNQDDEAELTRLKAQAESLKKKWAPLFAFSGLAAVIGLVFAWQGDKAYNQRSLSYAVREGSLEEVKRRLDQGADINAKDEHGWTALHWAAAENAGEIIAFLLEKGAKASVTNKSGRLPSELMKYVPPDLKKALAKERAEANLQGSGSRGGRQGGLFAS